MRQETSLREKNYLYFLFLGLLFFGSLVIAFIAIRFLEGYWREDPAVNVERLDPLFPNSVPVNGGEDGKEITPGSSLNPTAQHDFMVVTWFKIRALPKPGEKLIVLSKIDEKSRFLRGYALGLSREVDGIRPVAYWRDSEGNGGWRSFSEVAVLPRSWCMLALSFYKGRYLGVYFKSILEGLGNDDLAPVPVGGFDLGETEVVAESSSPLLLGSKGINNFRGRLGPLGIFSGKRFQKRIESILEQIGSEPLSLPTEVERDEVLLWTTDFRLDQSNSAHVIKHGRSIE